MPLLEVKELGIDFGGLRALTDVDLTIDAGEIVGLIGPNGAGKTTVFNLLTGVYTPTRGAHPVRRQEHYRQEALSDYPDRYSPDLSEHPALQGDVGAGQHPGGYQPHHAVSRDLLLLPPARLLERGAGGGGAGQRAAGSVRYGIGGGSRWPANLPYGMQRKLEIRGRWPPILSFCCWMSRPPG